LFASTLARRRFLFRNSSFLLTSSLSSLPEFVSKEGQDDALSDGTSGAYQTSTTIVLQHLKNMRVVQYIWYGTAWPSCVFATEKKKKLSKNSLGQSVTAPSQGIIDQQLRMLIYDLLGLLLIEQISS